ncbi:uncharacterized protein LOC130935582 [Arachis stenosperma]|uniref:uncharacterized protein LOC130935582 n=1 Tax=Arachis stenosperma TaxID=217475 RepID=UPI0025ABAD18|nr:uncharacterized protein LOC130935582 [Arachis stenosperma]
MNLRKGARQDRHVLGIDETGSGKTAAFALPILHHLSEHPFVVVGGMDMLQQTKELAARPHVIIATLGRIKALLKNPDIPLVFARTKVNRPVLVENTCLCFNALKGLPSWGLHNLAESIDNAGLHDLFQKFRNILSSFANCFGTSNWFRGSVDSDTAEKPREQGNRIEDNIEDDNEDYAVY